LEKFLKGNIVLYICLSNIFFGFVSLGKSKTGKNQQMGLHQAKSFYIGKEIINKMKRQPTEWEKIFTNDIFDKWLISKIHRKLPQLSIKKNNTIKKWAEDLNR